ncbi:hypothetical protein AZE42_08650 [Rhizopogon vesiculosus]|uniref:Uncharacterized protein n=1 Tax=Rhizopogon vesiculosus TaxID=180088 RepID=A0A1J8QI92_9AGAM|nr:hypothetical protein AZE42_08650 [Rhizopogon vesiculosus]
MGDNDLRVGDTKDARDLPDDLTPFITRTTTDPIGAGGFVHALTSSIMQLTYTD